MSEQTLRQRIHDPARSILGWLWRPLDIPAISKLTGLETSVVASALAKMQAERLVYEKMGLWGRVADRAERSEYVLR